MSDPEPTEECIRGTVFGPIASDTQLALPIGARYSLSDEQIFSLRALVLDNTEKEAELAALRAELGLYRGAFARVIDNARLPRVEVERMALLYHFPERYAVRYGPSRALKEAEP